MRPRSAFPSQVDFRSLAPSTRLRHVDRASAVAAELVREAKQHELSLTMLCRFACLVEQDTPAFVADVVLYQFLHPLPTSCRGDAARLLAMFDFQVFRIRRQVAKVGDR